MAALLADLAAQIEPPQVIVEIGSYQGRSTTALASLTTTTVFAVDPWDSPGNPNGRFGFAEETTRLAFDANIRHYPNIVPLQGFSVEVAAAWNAQDSPPVGLLYIDGDHSEQSVLADFFAWKPHLAQPATVVFDDYISETGRSPGVGRAVRSLGISFDIMLDRVAVAKL